jgi:hypothetical protein
MGTGGNCSAACVSSPTGNIFSVLSNGTTTNIFSLVGTTTDQNIYGGSSSISTFYNGDSRDKLPLIIRNKTKSKNYLSLLRGASNTTISTDGGSNPGSGSTGANYHPTGTGGNGNSDISPSSYKSVVGIPATNAFKVGANSILFEDIIGTSLESKVLPGAGGNYKTANNPVATGGGSIFSLQGNYISSIPPAGVGASGILGVNANHYHATGSGAAIVRFPIDVAPGDVISITLGYAASLNIDTATDPTVLNGPAAALIEWDDPS